MNTKDAQKMIEEEMKKWGLKGWRFRYLMDEKNLGLCTYRGQIITLSLQWTSHSTEEVVLDTGRHEISHSLNYIRNGLTGHGPAWKKICREVGCKPEEFYKGPPMPHRYEIYNKETKEVYLKLRNLPKNADKLSKSIIPGKPWTLGKLMFRRVMETKI